MKPNTAVLLVFVSVLVCSDAFTRLTPAGKELIYDYHARLRLGTFEPAEFASQFILDGKLHMQNDDNSLLMRFSDLKFKLYNGEINGVDEKESLPLNLPDEAKDILKPFMVTYNADGKAKHIETEKHEPEFSRNIKKSIASIMQLDMKEIKLDSKSPHAFETVETDIYGEGLVGYNVIPEEHDIIIQKMIDVTNSTHWHSYLGVMDEDWFSADKLPLAMDSQRKYTLVKDDHDWHIKRIKTHGGIAMNIMKGLSVSQQMSTVQRMQLLEIIPIKDKMSIAEKHTEDDLIFDLDYNTEAESLNDLSFGRSGMTMENYEKMVLNILDDIVMYLDENHIVMEKPNIKQGQAVNRLHNVMGQLNLATFEHLFVTLEEKTSDHDKKKFIAFQEMIPLIGTRASTMLIRNVIRKKKVSDEMAISMLHKMPFYLRMPRDSLLREVEDLMDLENVSESVRHAALLSFASLISKVHALDLKHRDEEHIKSLDKYILKIMDWGKATKDYSLKYLYMSALYNIRFVSKHLEPYITGEATTNRHVRYLAMCAAFKEMSADCERTFDIYWPIMTDRTQHLELRSAALLTILASDSSPGRLRDIYWVLKNDPSPDMYHLFYTYLTSTAHSKDPEVPEQTKVQVAQVLNTMHKPFRHPMTGFYSKDYIDPKYGFAAMVTNTLIHTNRSTTMYIDFENKFYSMPITYKGLWIKIDGCDETIIEKSPKQHTNPQIQMLLRMLSTLKDQKDIHIEYGLMYHDKVVDIHFFDHNNIDELIHKLENLMANIVKKSLHISYDMVTEIVLPNDMGFSTMIQYRMPRITNNEITITDEKTDDTLVKHVVLKLQMAQHAALEMLTYNPIAGFWQGIHRVQLYDSFMPMDIKLAMSKQLNDFKITINRNHDEKAGVMGMRIFSRTSVSATLGDRHNLLQQSSKHSEPFAEVTRGPKYQKTNMLFDHECLHTGLKYQIATFNTELHVSRRTTMELLDLVSQKSFKNMRTTPDYLRLIIRNLLAHLVLAPKPESFGFVMRGIPSTEPRVDKIELSLRILKSSQQPNQKLNTHASLSTKTKEGKVMNEWDLDLLFEENLDHTVKNFNLEYTRMQHEKENYRVCMDSKKEWKNNKLIGHMKMTMGHTADPKLCVDNEGTVEIDMHGQQSEEQRKLMAEHLTYKECSRQNMHEQHMRIPMHESLECLKKQTSVRHFEYDMKLNGMSHEHMMEIHEWIDYMKAMFLPYYSMEKPVTTMKDKNVWKMIIEYPIAGHEMNMTLLNAENNMKLIEAPTHYLSWLGFHPDTYYFSHKFLKLQHWGLAETCVINEEQLLNTKDKVVKMEHHDWMQIAHSNPEVLINHTLAVFLKKDEATKHMALRLIMDDQKLEMTPAGEEMQIILNEKPMVVEKGSYDNQPLFAIGKLQDKHHTIILHVYRIGLYMAFDGEHMIMGKPKMYKSLAGTCFSN